MLDKKDITLGLSLITGRARSAAKALSIVAQDITRHRSKSVDPKILTLNIDEDQLLAFQYLVDNVLALTREAVEVAEVLTRSTRDGSEATTSNSTKVSGRKSDDEDYLQRSK